MRLVVSLEARFSLTPDGNAWTETTFSESFWRRYLDVFDTVRIVARAKVKALAGEKDRLVTGAGVEFFGVPYYIGPFEYLRKRCAVKEALREAVGDGDAVLMRVPSRLADDLVPNLWASGRPYGLEVVADPYEVFSTGAVRHPLRPLFRRISTRNLQKQCARATAVSYVTQHTLQRRYPSAERPMGNGDLKAKDEATDPHSAIRDTYFSSVELSDKDYVAEARSYADGRAVPRVAFVGSLEQMYKGADVLLRAIALLRRESFPVRSVIIGDGRHRAELERLATTLGVTDSVEFMGQLPAGSAIQEQLDRADLFIMPSRTEGLPRAMVEAMARALPCIGSNVGGIPELLEPEHLFAAGDAAGLAQKMKNLLSDTSTLNRASRRNLQVAQQFRSEVLQPRRNQFYSFLRQRTEEWLRAR